MENMYNKPDDAFILVHMYDLGGDGEATWDFVAGIPPSQNPRSMMVAEAVETDP